MDFYAMLHAFALIAVLYRRRRKAIAEIWPKYCCFLACMLTVQYFVCIGIPPAACKGLCNQMCHIALRITAVCGFRNPTELNKNKQTLHEL